MKGLLIKDAILIKKYCVFHFVISVAFFAGSLANQSNMFFRFYSVVMLSIIPITISAYDEQCKWNTYEAVLPISRKQTVIEKYIIALIMTVPSTIIYSAILIVLQSVNLYSENASEIIFSAPLMLLFGILPPSIMLPIIFKFGYLKGRIIKFIFIAVLAAMISIVSYGYISVTETQNLFNAAFAIIVLAVVVVIFVISLLISNAVYRNKEF